MRCSLSCSGNPSIEGVTREEAWRPVAGLKSLKRAPEQLLVKVQPSCCRDASILEMPGSQDNHQGQQQVWNGADLSLQAVCAVNSRDRKVRLCEPFAARKSRSESQTWGYLHSCCLVCLGSDCDCARAHPYWSNKVFNLFLILQESTVKRL